MFWILIIHARMRGMVKISGLGREGCGAESAARKNSMKTPQSTLLVCCGDRGVLCFQF